jgi:hypothetical protein
MIGVILLNQTHLVLLAMLGTENQRSEDSGIGCLGQNSGRYAAAWRMRCSLAGYSDRSLIILVSFGTCLRSITDTATCHCTIEVKSVSSSWIFPDLVAPHRYEIRHRVWYCEVLMRGEDGVSFVKIRFLRRRMWRLKIGISAWLQ